MYYPFLRGRQFELIALRELAIEGFTQEHILPIIEPVKKSFNNLTIANSVFQDERQTAYLILNPLVGEIKGDKNHYLAFLAELENTALRPAFYFNDNGAYIRQSIADYNLDDCMLICQNSINPDDPLHTDVLEMEKIGSICIKDPGRNRVLDRYIKTLGVSYIRLDDFFEKKDRNKDFLLLGKHRFSEEHIYYNGDGYDGFSDYTVLPSEYIDGGSTPRAVVIHITYLNEKDQIWIRHFTSDTNDSIANVQGKFAEAAEKAVNYCRSNGITNSATEELESYFNNEHYPGLGTVKKISIKNHLLTVGQYLNR